MCGEKELLCVLCAIGGWLLVNNSAIRIWLLVNNSAIGGWLLLNNQ